MVLSIQCSNENKPAKSTHTVTLGSLQPAPRNPVTFNVCDCFGKNPKAETENFGVQNSTLLLVFWIPTVTKIILQCPGVIHL